MKIIKLTGKITGIAPVDAGSVNVRMKTETMVTQMNNTWQKTTPLKQEIILPYQGPARVSSKELEQLLLPDTMTENYYGIGANISDLFVDDEIEAYIQGHISIDASDNRHLIVNHVIINKTGKQPLSLQEFLLNDVN